MTFGSVRTGIFNVADVFITSGVVILFITCFTEKRAETVSE